jgi:TatD DNase family protein
MTSQPQPQPQPQPPRPLPHPVVDNHAHLDHARGDQPAVPVEQALAAAAAVGVTRMVTIGCDLESARWTVATVAQHRQLLGGVAVHPTEASRIVAEHGLSALKAAWAEIEQLADQPRVRVIGETGLDHYWVSADDVAGRAAQVDSFRWHIDLAKRADAVLQIHDRDAHAAVLQVLAEEGAPRKTVFHCFSGDAEMARFCSDQGWYLSFAGPVTFKNAEPLRAALAVVPIGQVLVETDAPYLAPSPHRGAPNAGHLLPHTVRAMAVVLQLPELELCRRLDATSELVYGPW